MSEVLHMTCTCRWSVCARVCCCVCSCCCCCCCCGGDVGCSAAPSLLRLISAWLRGWRLILQLPTTSLSHTAGTRGFQALSVILEPTRKIILYYYNIGPSMKSLSVRNEYLSYHGVSESCSSLLVTGDNCDVTRRNECNPSIILLQPNL